MIFKFCCDLVLCHVKFYFSQYIINISIFFLVLIDEPVWAIGTGLVCPAEVAQEVHAYIRSLVTRKYGKDVSSKSIIQYGGSVKADNVKEIMSMPDIDGCLVGGASLTADSFAKIIKFQQ